MNHKKNCSMAFTLYLAGIALPPRAESRSRCLKEIFYLLLTLCIVAGFWVVWVVMPNGVETAVVYSEESQSSQLPISSGLAAQISTSISLALTRTLYRATPLGAGGPSTSPVVTS